MFGKSLSEYVRLLKPWLLLITIVWAVRLGLSLAGVPDASVKFVSTTALLALSIGYIPWVQWRRGFGGHRELYGLFLVQGVFSQVLVALAIILAIFTGRDNIFTVPEFYPPSQGGSPLPVDGKNWGHVAAHVFIAGAIVFPLVTWLLGSIVLAVLRRSPKAT
jgi:hypothetical protein